MALFKIFNNIDSKNTLPTTTSKGFCYFDSTTKLFWIDIKDTPAGYTLPADINSAEYRTYRVPLNSYAAEGANFANALTTPRTLKIGNTGKTFDGSANVTWTLAEIGAQAAGNYKTKQSAVTTPAVQGVTTAFINNLSQDANGVITVSKAELDTSGTWNGKATTAGIADRVDHTLTIGGKTYNGSTDQSITLDDLGLSSALRFVGTTTTNVVNGSTITNPTINGMTSYTPVNGDVVLNTNNKREYVYIKPGSGTGTWYLLGTDDNYALKSYTDTTFSQLGHTHTATTAASSSTTTVLTSVKSAGAAPTLGTAISADDITAWDAGSVPTLGTAIAADDITAWSAGSGSFSYSCATTSISTAGAMTFSHAHTAPSLTYTARSIPNVTSVGSVPSLTYTARSIPNVTSVGSVPSLTYTARSIPNVTSVGSMPTFSSGSVSASGHTHTLTTSEPSK